MALAHATLSGRAAAPRAIRGGIFGDRTAFAPARCLSPARASTSARAVASDKTDENSPPYQVAKRAELYELRIYGAYYVAVAPYTNREQGLASLMGYIEGGNEDERTFPATQPLVMRYVDDGDGDFDKRMELCLGAGVSDPPAPTSPGVGVQAAGGELLAVVGFEGIATPSSRGNTASCYHRVARRRTRTRRARCLPARHLRTALLPQAQAQRAHAQGEVGGRREMVDARAGVS